MSIDSEKNPEHYLHRSTYNYRERRVGLFVFAGVILFLLFIVISVKNQHLFERRVTFYIELNSSEGISRGSIVTVLGAEAGRVSDLSLAQNHKIKVAIEVYKEQHRLIRMGAKVTVNRLTNIGNALIEIKSDSIDAPVLADGSTLPAEETPSLNDLLLGLANIVQSADNNNLLSKFELILPKIEQTLENVHEIIAQIASGHGTLGAAVFDQQVEKELKIVVTSGAEILTEAEGIVSVAKQKLVQIGPVLTDVKQVTHDMKGATKSLPEMIVKLNQIIGQVNTAMTLINDELAQIPGTAVEARRTLTKADRLLDSAQNIWPLSSNIQTPDSRQLIPPHPVYE